MPAIDRITGLTASIAYKAPCRVATDAQITLSGLQTIDGVALAEDDRVLVTAQTDASENGIYIASPNDWKRAADFDDNRDATNGTRVYVSAGSTLVGEWVVSLSGQLVIGTTDINWGAAPGHPPLGSIEMYKIYLALADPANPSGSNVVDDIRNAIDQMSNDNASGEWLGAANVKYGDALSNLIQSTLGWSAGQMAAFFTLARSKTA